MNRLDLENTDYVPAMMIKRWKPAENFIKKGNKGNNKSPI